MALSDTAIRLSVPRRSRPRRAAGLGYRHAGCLQLSYHRPPKMCGLQTRPRTDVDPPPPVELPSAGAYRLAASGAITRCYCCCYGICTLCSGGSIARYTEAVISVLKDSGDYDEVMCNRLRTILTAPHKHKGREARKTKELGIHSGHASLTHARVAHS